MIKMRFNNKKLHLALWLGVLIAIIGFTINSKKEVVCKESNRSDGYNDRHRPQFHFSPKANWMNDPNGMVYLEGEYHLFYQYYPDSTVWGPMHWGHAVSTDMVHWEHLPIALYPDSLGYIFSGSAVFDQKNTSGLGTLENPPLVAIYTYHNMDGEIAGRNDYQTQGIAYSTDKGRTWLKYAGNPVVANPGIRDFRDPKVLWYDAGKKWIMALAVHNHVELYSSLNLKEWVKESEFGNELGALGGVWECPELLQIKIDGSNERNWVLLVSINPGGPNGGSATQYFVGDFDGHQFTTQQTETKWIDYGTDNYAGVTWSNIPETDGRKLFIGWMSNWQYATVVPTEKWRSAMTFPRELTLSTNHILKSKPIKELELLRSKNTKINNKILNGIYDLTNEIPFSVHLAELNFNLELADLTQEVEFVFSNEIGENIIIALDALNQLISIDRTTSGAVKFSDAFYSKHYANTTIGKEVKLQILLDVASIELFLNDGETVMTDIFFPTKPFDHIEIITKGGEVLLDSCSVYKLNAIW